MAKIYDEEQLNKFDKETIIQLFLMQQEQLDEIDRKLQLVLEQLSVSKRNRYGIATEKMESSQLSFQEVDGEIVIIFNEAEALADENADELTEEVIKKKSNKRKGKRAEDLSNLPKEVINHDFSEDELKVLYPDEDWKRLPDEVYHRYSFTPAKIALEEHHVAVYSGKKTEHMEKAKHPAYLLRGSLVSPSLEAGIITGKYVNAAPFARLEKLYQQYNVPITRQNMANWTILCAERYLSILYDYQKTRKTDHPRQFLKDFRGVCVTDGYQVYHTLEGEREDLEIAGCWAHCRRRYDEAVKALPKSEQKMSMAYLALSQIQQIYHEEKQLQDMAPAERRRHRQKNIKPLVDTYFNWVRINIEKIMPKSNTHNGMTYSLNQEKYLRRFLDDGEIPIDNNAAEQSIRSFCIGKKNWVMCDTINGAKSSAIIYSLVETAKANKLRLYEYFNYLLTEIPEHMDDKNNDFCEKLLPWSDELPAECRK